jgi:hypothetical protein
MVRCTKCLLTFVDLGLYAEHLQNEHESSFDAGKIPFTLKFKNSRGNYREFQRKFDRDERAGMKTFEHISERLKDELPKVLTNVNLPCYFTVNLDLTMTETDSGTKAISFYNIRVQGKSIYITRFLPVENALEEILRDLDFKFKNGTNFSPGSSFYGLDSVLIIVNTGKGYRPLEKNYTIIPQYDENASPKERRKGWIYLYRENDQKWKGRIPNRKSVQKPAS